MKDLKLKILQLVEVILVLLVVDNSCSETESLKASTLFRQWRSYSNLDVTQNAFLRSSLVPSHLQNLLSSNSSFLFDGSLFTNNVTTECQQHTEEFIKQIFNNLNNLLSADDWALQMVDAWGKPPEGFLGGHVNAMGDFDECVSLRGRIKNDSTNIQSSFKGKYCTIYIIPMIDMKTKYTPEILLKKATSLSDLAELLILNAASDFQIIPSMASCLPSSCTNADVQIILQNAFQHLGLIDSIVPAASQCITDDKKDFSKGDIAMLCVLVVLGLFLLTGTMLDVWLRRERGDDEKDLGKGKTVEALVAFSVYTNTIKWMNTSSSGGELDCLNGLRTISTLWVVLGHTFLCIVMQPTWNIMEAARMYETSVLSLIILNGQVVVDTFFTLSGLLVSYNLLKILDKTKGRINIPLMYLNRFIRLTPAYALILGIGATLFTHFGSGPSWFIVDIWAGFCRKNWWKNLLYINAIVGYNPETDPTDLPCHGETWYLSTDMLLFLVSPFLIYPMWKWKRFGLGLMGVITFASILTPGIITYLNDYVPAPLPFRYVGSYTRKGYFPPWMRGAPYLVGIWTGYFIHKTKRDFKVPRIAAAAGWLLSTATALAVLLGIQPYFDPTSKIPEVGATVYGGLHRFSWGVSIAWVIFACSRGKGGWINRFLSCKAFIPLGRLGFTVFLVSLHVQFLLHLRFRQPFYIDNYTAVNISFAHMLVSYLVGFVCTITMESPFIQLERLLFHPPKALIVRKPELNQSEIGTSP